MTWKWFCEDEFYRSDIAQQYDIDVKSLVTESVLRNLEALITNCLDPLRTAFGHIIEITSGFRPKALNDLIGGHPNSHHLYGQAADITSKNNDKLFELAQKLPAFTELIIYKKEGSDNIEWIHISFDKSKLEKVVKKCTLTKERGKIYEYVS
jgi:hypothetical protein